MIDINDFEPDIYDTDDDIVRQCARELMDDTIDWQDAESIGEFLHHLEQFLDKHAGRMPRDPAEWWAWRRDKYGECAAAVERILKLGLH